jgi:hypothetical protein
MTILKVKLDLADVRSLVLTSRKNGGEDHHFKESKAVYLIFSKSQLFENPGWGSI